MSRRNMKSFASLHSSFGTKGHCTLRLCQCPGRFRANEPRNFSWTLIAMIAIFSWLTALAGRAIAQNQPGHPNWSAYDAHDIDTINLATLNAEISAPGMKKSGAFPFALAFDGVDSLVSVQASGSTQIYPSPLNLYLYEDINAGGLRVGAYATETFNQPCPGGDGSGNNATEYSNWYIAMLDGTIHLLPSTATVFASSTCTSSFSALTIDGSGYTVTVVAAPAITVTVTARDGSIPSQTNYQLKDSNGNTITYATSGGKWTDTLGTTVLTETNEPPNETVYSWTAGTASPQIKLSTIGYTMQSEFACSGYSDYSVAENIPSELSYPDGTSILIGFEPTPYPGSSSNRVARIQNLTLRYGGTVAYNWNPTGGANDGLNCTYLVPNEITRTTTDGTTQYSIAWQTSGGSCSTAIPCSQTTVLDPGKNKTVYYFSAGWNAPSAVPQVVLALTGVLRYINTGTVASPVWSNTPDSTDYYCYNTTSYNSSPAGCSQGQVTEPVTQMWDYHAEGNGATNHQGKYSASTTKYDAYGDVKYSALYDFGSSTIGFQTFTTYGSTTTCTAWTGVVRDKLCEILKEDGIGNKLSDVKMAHDAYGNLLSTSVFNGNVYIGQTLNNVYYSNGTLAKSFDIANNETDYAYSSGSYSDCGISCTALTTYPFPTTITNKGTGLYTQATWDGTGGVPLTAVDMSMNTTIYGYDAGQCTSTTADPFWRMSRVTDPNGNEVCSSWINPNTFQSWFSFNSGNSALNLTKTFDGYDRLTNSALQEGPSSGSYDMTSASYAWSGIYFNTFGSIPCVTTSVTADCIAGVNTLYDVLNRPITATETGSNGVTTYTYPVTANETKRDVLIQRGPAPSWDGEHIKQIQNEYDGFGRLTTSCAIGTVSGSASCNELTGSSSGIVTTYAYTTGVGYYKTVATRGSQAKTTYRDSLGRVTETITPDAGTWNYYYDSVSTPGCHSGYTGVVGKLEASKDPNGNLICYAYDSLGRVTGIWANGTTCRHFYYDTTYGTLPSGVTTPTNTLGRIAEASTDNCSGTLITDEWFSYDKDGNKTDLWETTPNAGRYFHSVATFAGNNAVLTTHLEVPSLITTTYTLDGEGRWNGASNNNGSGVTIVPSSPGVTYNAAGQPTNIPLGSSTDYDSYTYDANTGRMKTWLFQVGTGSSNQENATLTWNPIGSLESLAITDDFNSSGTQTCTFGASGSQGYDDLGRLLYDSCVSGSTVIWGQTFSYDIYNNLTKARLLGATNGTTFNPTYNTTSGCSPCNNQYQSGYFASYASYDSNGNQLYDPSNLNTYAWNEFSKMASIDKSGTNCATSGTCVTYDAFGRDVEIDSGTTYTEIFYTQVGKALQHGSTEVYSYWGLPGGGTQVFSGNTGYLHKDWLGSARLMSNISAQTITSDQALSPYGEQYARNGNIGSEAMFTGDTQDISSGTSGLWDTPNRELGSAPSRWLSPDPAGAGWNSYAYSTNPNSEIDPSGLDPRCRRECGYLPGNGRFGTGSDGGYDNWDNYQVEIGGTPGDPAGLLIWGTVRADGASDVGQQVMNAFNSIITSIVGLSILPQLFTNENFDAVYDAFLNQDQHPYYVWSLGQVGDTITNNYWTGVVQKTVNLWNYQVGAAGDGKVGYVFIQEVLTPLYLDNTSPPPANTVYSTDGSMIDEIGLSNSNSMEPPMNGGAITLQTFNLNVDGASSIDVGPVNIQVDRWQNGQLQVGQPIRLERGP
jgi:hypothetical protein